MTEEPMTDPKDQPAHAQPRFENRLARETSPYLLQHKNNPVDWYPWGEEAFEKARRENKPLLISIGYSACHWCHVMEHESFENEAIARLVNETVVPIKVDREERPDVDAIYMDVCMAMTGQGGWPLNAFVTPELNPFFVGTYFPPEDRYGRPGFASVIRQIGEAWGRERLEITAQARDMTEQMARYKQADIRQPVEEAAWSRLVAEASSSFDLRWGGFGGAPKFPPDQKLAALLAAYHGGAGQAALDMVCKTLDGMASGGMYDQLGGGFARYSVDEKWLIPHFEKMLYNQALLVPVYLDSFLLTGNAEHRRVAVETLDWVLRDLCSPEGPFYCALDADSEGEEGKYYVWTPGEVHAILGDSDGALFCDYYDVTPGGNFEHGTSALRLREPLTDFCRRHGISESDWSTRLPSLKAKLLEVRYQRVAPGLDDKCLTGWNGLMISALSRGFQVLGDLRYLDSARKAAEVLLLNQRPAAGTLLRSRCKGQSRIAAVLEDYSYFIAGLLDLHESCFDAGYLNHAAELASEMNARFADPRGGFFYAAEGDNSLIMRTREMHDGALPSPASVAAQSLLRLHGYFQREDFRSAAMSAIEAAGPGANRMPSAFGSALLAARFAKGPTPQIVITGDSESASTSELLNAAWTTYLPSRVIANVSGQTNTSNLPILGGKSADGPSRAYVCFDYACKEPVGDAQSLRKQLESAK
ncbi:MAG: thioredoxin domain-containing protein [Candidatus Sumerlaeaceae bacterium]|nr:thioredoxin domain-containing protein [Candidatus Sumerlaeaceae bacterium]